MRVSDVCSVVPNLHGTSLVYSRGFSILHCMILAPLLLFLSACISLVLASFWCGCLCFTLLMLTFCSLTLRQYLYCTLFSFHLVGDRSVQCLTMGGFRLRRFLLLVPILCLALIPAFFYFKDDGIFETNGKSGKWDSQLASSSAQNRWNDDELLILYNRVPKTGSTSFMGVAYELCRTNRFHAIHVNISKNSHIMSLADQAKFLRNITTWTQKKPAIYHGHVAFIDFTKFGMNNPVYINLIREPLERFVSYYYFLRYGDDFRPHLVRKKAGNNETFDECVERSGKDCDVSNMWLQVPFFCGHAYECWIPGSRWAFERAKDNLLKHYLLVGTTDELLEFVSVLEATLPRFFKGATTRLATGKKSHLRKTVKKIPPSERTVERIQRSDVWKLENEFYEFAKAQFRFVKERLFDPDASKYVGGGGDAETGGIRVPVPRRKEFHFEKVKP